VQDSANRPRATVIDHDADVVDLLCELLELQGFDCDKQTSALPGIEALTASRPDLIVVDLGVRHVREELTGLQIVHSARSGAVLRDVPVVVLTTDIAAIGDVWPEVMARGDVHRLEKPFNLTAFERVINTAMGRPHAGMDRAGADGPHLVSERAREAPDQRVRESGG
jgi:CheY-like chemotaxis protein